VVRQYQQSDYDAWNAFVDQAKNATFLFHRDFMEYHQDRFEDFSLLIFDKNKLVAILPANRVGDTVYSHQGLTYGGLVYNNKMRLEKVISIFRSILFFLSENKINKIHIKTLPSIYQDQPAEELSYALFLAEAKLERRDSLAVIDLSIPYFITNGRKEGIRKGIHANLKIKEVYQFEDFWNEILIPNLINKHKTNPVHNIEEITKLKRLFPENIRQFNVYYDENIVAGTTVFESKNVAHSQYISANESKNENGSLDLLHYYLLTEVFKEKQFFDFGVSNECQGKILNRGLAFWKESFGACTMVQDFYEVSTSNFSLLDTVLR
jgi:hypothetical protein